MPQGMRSQEEGPFRVLLTNFGCQKETFWSVWLPQQYWTQRLPSNMGDKDLERASVNILNKLK